MQKYSNIYCVCWFLILFLIRTKQPQKVPQKMSSQEFWGLHCIKNSQCREFFSYLIKAHTQNRGLVKILLYYKIVMSQYLRKTGTSNHPWDVGKNKSISSADTAEHALLIFNICTDKSNHLAGSHPHLGNRIQLMFKFSHPRLLWLLVLPLSPEPPRPVKNKWPALQKSWFFLSLYFYKSTFFACHSDKSLPPFNPFPSQPLKPCPLRLS